MTLEKTDNAIYVQMQNELKRQQTVLNMIPSENYVSKGVLEAVSSVLINKYSEGYATKRYYQGNSEGNMEP